MSAGCIAGIELGGWAKRYKGVGGRGETEREEGSGERERKHTIIAADAFLRRIPGFARAPANGEVGDG